MTVFHEAHACLINKISAFSPQSFGEKQGGVLSTVQSRRVELHELHVPQARTGPEGHSIPIPRRHIRVRGVGEELPGPSRSQHCGPVSYTHLRAHETVLDLVCRLLLEKKKKKNKHQSLLQ